MWCSCNCDAGIILQRDGTSGPNLIESWSATVHHAYLAAEFLAPTGGVTRGAHIDRLNGRLTDLR